jgi:ABC-type Fe3+-hydroxamate transport system substrate-binding protein
MKKILLFIVSVFMLFTLTGCSKTVISTDQVKSIAGNNGYTATDIISQYVEAPQIKEATVFINDANGYQVEFYVLENIDSAIGMYNTNVSKFDQYDVGTKAKATVNGKNYSTYSLTTTDRHRYLSRVDNTLLYADVDVKYKDAVKEFIEKLGY